MNSRWRYFVVVLLSAATAIFYPGCASLEITHHDEITAGRHMEIADSLEQAGNQRAATLEYLTVAQSYPRSSDYPDAVRRVAQLFLDPGNTAASDSAAAYWLNVYLNLPVSTVNRQDARLVLSFLGRVSMLRQSMTRASAESDSLIQVVRKQGNALSGQSQRIQELEAELRQTRQELARLKEIDIRLSRTRKSR